MKNVLITGANSYIGLSFEKWVAQYPNMYSVDTVDMIDGTWKNKDFSQYDSVFHVAGIAHIRETKKNAELYYKVNRDLAVITAQKAKSDGVKQFIYLSSMSVYGIETGIITGATIPNPRNNYGKSKLQAEEQIKNLEDENFRIAVLRPPMVYGQGCKGNYQTLAKYALKLPVFPNIQNKRSMIYIDNLSEFVRCLIDNGESGLFCPQNKEYVCTSEMIKLIACMHGKKIRLTGFFNPLIKALITLKIKYINKVFGDLVCDSQKECGFIVAGFQRTIEETEKIQ